MEDKKITITVKMDGQEVERNFGEEKFLDYCDLGLEINGMKESIENSYRHNF